METIGMYFDIYLVQDDPNGIDAVFVPQEEGHDLCSLQCKCSPGLFTNKTASRRALKHNFLDGRKIAWHGVKQ